MKNFLMIVLTIFALTGDLFCQPTTITWQGKLLDADGNAITQNGMQMTFAIFDAETDGDQLWPASGIVSKTVDIKQGLYSLQLGTGVGNDEVFTSEMFNRKQPWLEVKIGDETLPRTPVTNVPFALFSNDLSSTGWESPGKIGNTTPNTGKFTALETGNLRIPNGAADGKILTSDSDGNASWSTFNAVETDPVFSSSVAHSITQADTTRWGIFHWRKSGDNILFQSGKVGIGSSDPSTLLKAPLNVEGGIRYAGGLDGTGLPGQLYYDAAANGTFRYIDNLGQSKVLGTGTISYTGTLWNETSGDLNTDKNVICQSSLAVGTKTTPGMGFGFATILLEEDNLRILFKDASETPGFPSNDWQLVANDQTSGGQNYFAIQDYTAYRTPFKVMAGAPDNSLFISSNGRLGIYTSSPARPIHIYYGNTPGIRFDQHSGSGYTPQIWDINAHEEEFFITDVTHGSNIPFKIRTGAPTNSLVIGTNGNIGIGTYTPQQKLHVTGIMRLEPIDEPAVAGEGDIYYDKNTHKARCYDGTMWHDLW